jgi:hypothetical protein
MHAGNTKLYTELTNQELKSIYVWVTNKYITVQLQLAYKVVSDDNPLNAALCSLVMALPKIDLRYEAIMQQSHAHHRQRHENVNVLDQAPQREVQPMHML